MRARREAQRAIAGARAALRAGESTVFYDNVAGAVRDYLAAKLDLPPGGVTAETVAECLRGKGITQPTAGDLREFFATCERVRFAPAAAADGDMQHTLERAAAIIRGFERARRLAPLLAVIALLAGLAGVGWAAGGASLQTLFFRGNELYGAERYAEAAGEYEKILTAGSESGHLHFNLGNAYFKAGDTGRAILEYERARRLMPRDPDLRANLGYARTLAGEGEEAALYERLFFPLAARLGGDEILLAASAAYSALMLLLVVSRLFSAAQRAARGGAAAAGLALAVLVSSGAFRLAEVDLPTYAVVVAKQGATVRFEPSTTGTIYFEAGPGSVLRVLVKRDAWVQVARGDGRRGWVELAALEEI
jgi:tetratricopeptide (TPR) repeat protein